MARTENLARYQELVNLVEGRYEGTYLVLDDLAAWTRVYAEEAREFYKESGEDFDRESAKQLDWIAEQLTACARAIEPVEEGMA